MYRVSEGDYPNIDYHYFETYSEAMKFRKKLLAEGIFSGMIKIEEKENKSHKKITGKLTARDLFY